MKELDEVQAGKLKEAINHSDRKHYHVIRINITTVEGEARNKVGFNISKHHPNGFEKLKGNFKMMGINRLIVLHDPSQLKEEPTQTISQHEKISIQAKAESDVKAEQEAEINKRVEAEMARVLAEKELEADKQKQENELNEGFESAMKNNATVEVIDLFAKDYAIEFGDEVKNKADKQAVIKKWFESKEV